MQQMSRRRSIFRTPVSGLPDHVATAVQVTQKNGPYELADLLDYHDLARITGESVITHRRRKMLGTGPRALHIGRHIRFHPRDVSEWLERCAQTASKRTEVV